MDYMIYPTSTLLFVAFSASLGLAAVLKWFGIAPPSRVEVATGISKIDARRLTAVP
jgi:hypothetical protein